LFIEILISKLQFSNFKQIPNFKNQTFANTEFGYWDLYFGYYLSFVICLLRF